MNLNNHLPFGTPESMGLSSRKLLQMVRALERSGTEMHGIMICRHGKVVLEGWWKPYTRETIHICHSFGKSYVASAVGAACTQGLMSVDDRVIDFFPDEIRSLGLDISENLRELCVKHVLIMSNGMSKHALAGEDLIKNYLTTPVDSKPGQTFMYNTAGSCMLSEIVRRVTGKSVLDYLTEMILVPIGCDLEHFHWMTFHSGLHPAPGVASCTENNLRLGMLYLQNGCWEGKQLIDEHWIRDATHCQIDNGLDGYGYQLWMYRTPDTFRFSGGHGQDCFMNRPNDLVLAINQAASEPHDIDANFNILDPVLFETTLPEQLEEDPDGLAELLNYMGSLTLPQASCEPLHGYAEGWDGVYHRKDGQFHLQPELCPFGDENVNADFYVKSPEAVQKIEIRRCEEGFWLTLDNSLYFLARFDGQWIPQFAQSAMSAYNQSCAVVTVEKDRLIITQWFYQTCFKTRLWLDRDDNKLHVRVRKDRLHDDRPYLWREAFFCKE